MATGLTSLFGIRRSVTSKSLFIGGIEGSSPLGGFKNAEIYYSQNCQRRDYFFKFMAAGI